MREPKQYHGAAMKHVLRHLQGTLTHGLVFGGASEMKLVGFSDSSHMLMKMMAEAQPVMSSTTRAHRSHDALINKKQFFYHLANQSLWQKQRRISRLFGFKNLLVT